MLEGTAQSCSRLLSWRMSLSHCAMDLPLTVWHRRPTGCMKWPGTFRLMSCNNVYTHAHKQGFIENGSGGGGGGTRVQLTVFRGVICS